MIGWFRQIWTVNLEKTIYHWTHNVSLSWKDRHINNVKDHVENITYTTDSYTRQRTTTMKLKRNQALGAQQQRLRGWTLKFTRDKRMMSGECRITQAEVASSTSCVLPDWHTSPDWDDVNVISKYSISLSYIILLWDDVNACDWIKETPQDYLWASEANGRRLDMNDLDLENNTAHKLLLTRCAI